MIYYASFYTAGLQEAVVFVIRSILVTKSNQTKNLYTYYMPRYFFQELIWN